MAALAILLMVCLDASAQRTMRGQMFLDLEGQYPLGASVAVGQYTLPGYWQAGVNLLQMREYLRLDGAVDLMNLDTYHLKAEGGYMFRLLSTRSRSFGIYGGAFGWVGIEAVDPLKVLPEDILLNIDKGRSFVFGATPRLEAQLFFGNHIALVIGGEVPIAVRSRIKMFNPQGTAGLRFAF